MWLFYLFLGWYMFFTISLRTCKNKNKTLFTRENTGRIFMICMIVIFVKYRKQIQEYYSVISEYIKDHPTETKVFFGVLFIIYIIAEVYTFFIHKRKNKESSKIKKYINKLKQNKILMVLLVCGVMLIVGMVIYLVYQNMKSKV
jgi:TRAP-type C4-dicarboxylate transport system permease large subunit